MKGALSKVKYENTLQKKLHQDDNYFEKCTVMIKIGLPV
jgi:hypothetical protein